MWDVEELERRCCRKRSGTKRQCSCDEARRPRMPPLMNWGVTERFASLTQKVFVKNSLSAVLEVYSQGSRKRRVLTSQRAEGVWRRTHK